MKSPKRVPEVALFIFTLTNSPTLILFSAGKITTLLVSDLPDKNLSDFLLNPSTNTTSSLPINS